MRTFMGNILLLFTVFLSLNAQESRITIAIGAIEGTGRADTLRTMLTTAFVKESRYILMERDGLENLAMESIMGEKNPALLEGADYVLLANVTKANVTTSQGGVLFATGTSEQAEIEFDIRLVDVQTGRIVYSDHVSDKTKGNVSVNIASINTKAGNNDLLGELLRPIVEKQIYLITQKLYPTRVVAQNKRMVILNFGSDRFEAGNELSILELGEAVFDPDTGILLYQESSIFDKAIVFEVNDKISKAYLVKYDSSKKIDPSISGIEFVLKNNGEPVVRSRANINKLKKLYEKGI